VRRDECAALVFAVAALVYFTRVAPSANARGVIVSLGFVYGRFVVGSLALRHAARDGASYACRLIAVAAWLGALVYLARIVAIVLGLAPALSFLQPSPWNIALLGLAIVSLPCMSTGMVMLAHERILRRMEKLATVDELTGALTRRAFMAGAGVARAPARAAARWRSPFSTSTSSRRSTTASAMRQATGCSRIFRGSSLRRSGRAICSGGWAARFAVAFVDVTRREAEASTNALRVAVECSSTDGVSCTLSAGVDSIGATESLESAIARGRRALRCESGGRNRVAVAAGTHEGNRETGYLAALR
jgi:GGDEF domain-containing protein